MRLIKKLFVGDPLAAARKALQQRRWADALTVAEAIDPASLSPEAADELESLLVAAGDGLAELNLAEGEGCLRSGDSARAAEHFALAAAQARTAELQARVATARAFRPDAGSEPSQLSTVSHSCASACSHHGSGGHGATPATVDQGDLDPATRLELVLASYPDQVAAGYADCGEDFLEAFLLAHEGHEAEALKRFDRIPQSDRGALFFFERGSLFGRLGEVDRACRDLEKVLELVPDHRLAIEALVTIESSIGREGAARKRLESLLQSGYDPAFSHGALAVLCARSGDAGAALEHGTQAISAGSRDPEALMLTATLLERTGRIDDAERLLQALPGGGCSGGASIALAEFWLRQGKNLDKALESFKGALRQEPGQPLWAIRIAQTYLARGWKKDGMALLEKTLADPGLDPDLRREALHLLRTLSP